MDGYVYFYSVVMYIIFCDVSTEEYHWGPWSVCSKTCDIGTQIRIRRDGTDTEEQYCNPRYCSKKQSCTNAWGCYPQIRDGTASCSHNTCYCTLGTYYNTDNCFIEYGNCVIREDPPTALGYKDTHRGTYPYGYKLNSCTTADNPVFDVHVIGIYGDRYYDVYEVTVLPRGPVTKPIILVLTSYEATRWRINTAVAIYEVLYSGYKVDDSSVEKTYSSRCDFRITKRPDLSYGHGTDTGGGHTLDLLKQLNNEFGPVTSFTGYYELSNRGVSHIILKVGGNPLAVISKEFTYNISAVNCTVPNITAIPHSWPIQTPPPPVHTRRPIQTTPPPVHTQRPITYTTTMYYTTTQSSPHGGSDSIASIAVAAIIGSVITLLIVALVLYIMRRKTATSYNSERRPAADMAEPNTTQTAEIPRSRPIVQYPRPNASLTDTYWTGNESAPPYEDLIIDDRPPAYEDLFKNNPTVVYNGAGKLNYTDGAHGYPR